jgi:hypothetical protein
MAERWPPVYDADDLKAAIRQFAVSASSASLFFMNPNDGGSFCQGDVLAFPCEVPEIDEDGQVVVETAVSHLLLLGNTCDVQGPAQAPYTQAVPLAPLADTTDSKELLKYREYKPSRCFYVPRWSADCPSLGYLADLTRPITLRRGAIDGHGKVVARMSQAGWILLHAALVRFLARDDGRFDEEKV